MDILSPSIVYPHAIGRFPSALTWDELRAMARQGVDIESHSMTHPAPDASGKADEPEGLLRLDRRGTGRLETPDWRRNFTARSPRSPIPMAVMTSTSSSGRGRPDTAARSPATMAMSPALRIPSRLNRRLVFRQTSLQAFARSLNQRPLWVTAQSPADGERVKADPKRNPRAHTGCRENSAG